MGHIWTRVDGGRISPKRPEQQVERRSALGKTLVVWPFQPRQGTGGEVGEPRRSRASRWSSWHDGASRSSMVRLGRGGERVRLNNGVAGRKFSHKTLRRGGRAARAASMRADVSTAT